MRTLLFLLLGLVILASPAQAQTGWKTYTNARFGFRISYPATLLLSRAPDNGGGQEFHTEDEEFSLAAYGRFLMRDDGESLDVLFQDELRTLGKTVTYQRKTANWYVVSGVTPEGLEYYHKTHVQGGNVAAFEITYPHAKNKTYDPWVERIAKSFVPFLKSAGYDR